MPNNQAHDPRVATAGERVAVARTLSVAAAPVGAGFSPLIAENFASGVAGQQAVTSGSSWNAKSTYDQTRAFSGSQSMKVRLASETVGTCVGEHDYGGYVALPVNVPKGKNLWLRYKMYIPSTFSWGFTYRAEDPKPAGCGLQNDGSGQHKFIVFESSDFSGKIYLQPQGSFRDVAPLPGIYINTDLQADGETVYGELGSNAIFPFDQWFDLQIQLFVDDVNGFYRLWLNDSFIGQLNGKTISAASAAISKVGIGGYWNGAHYTDGQTGRSEFWVDEMIVASDVDGYGAPTGQDAGGRTFIDPATLVGSL